MKFCSSCGSAVELKIPENDNRPRFICGSCEEVHYQNPNVVTGCIPEWQDKILICKRAIEPRKNLWTLPAGFMENGETIQQGAARESLEEANAIMQDMRLFSVYSIPHISQVYMFYLARLSKPVFAAGDESLEVKLFSEDEIPWDDIAFKTVKATLRHYFEDRKAGSFPVHTVDIERW